MSGNGRRETIGEAREGMVSSVFVSHSWEGVCIACKSGNIIKVGSRYTRLGPILRVEIIHFSVACMQLFERLCRSPAPLAYTSYPRLAIPPTPSPGARKRLQDLVRGGSGGLQT